jgi:heme exporter protein B
MSGGSMTGSAWAIFKREIVLAMRDAAALGTALGFYLIVVSLLPLGLGPDTVLLSRIAPGALWIALLLSALLSLVRMFEADHADGSLAVLMTAPVPMELIVLLKICAHGVTTTLPLILASPLVGLLLNLAPSANVTLVVSMLLGAPAISAIGAIGAALTLASRKGGLLIALLVLPLYVPTLIFGISALEAQQTAAGGSAQALLLLAAISLTALVVAPFAAAAALRVHGGA